MTEGKVGISGAVSLSGGNEIGSNYSPVWKPELGAWAAHPKYHREGGLIKYMGRSSGSRWRSVECRKFQYLPPRVFVKIEQVNTHKGIRTDWALSVDHGHHHL